MRSVYCADNTGNPVNDQQLAEEMCPPQEAPQSYQECKVEKLESANTEQHQHFSQGRWIVGDWSQVR